MQVFNEFNRFLNSYSCLIFCLLIGNFACEEPQLKSSRDTGTLLWVNDKHSDKSIKRAVKKTLDNTTLIVAQISWSPKDTMFFKNTEWYFSLAKDHGKKFMIAIDWQKSDRSGAIDSFNFKDKKYSDSFCSSVEKLVKKYNPDYINLGIEVNYYAMTSPEGFKAFASTFRKLKKRLKTINPNLKVGLSYQLELLFGHHKYWDKTETLITLENLAGDLDYLGISTYPNMATEDNPKDILKSISYLDTIRSFYSFPMGISETSVSALLYNHTERQLYINTIYKKAQKLKFNFVIWGSMIDDTDGNNWFNTSGLLTNDGFAKKEFETWEIGNRNFLR